MFALGRWQLCAAALVVTLLTHLRAQSVGGDGQEVRVCVPYESTDSALSDCTAAFATANTEDVQFVCTKGGSAQKCIQMMADGAAHASVLDGGDVVYAHDTFGMQPLVVEKSGGATSDGHDYAVAVVRKELCEASAAASLASLESANSCHGGFRTMAGWNIPVGVLHSEVSAFRASGNLDDVSDDAELVARFFGRICAPRTTDMGPMYVAGETSLWENGLCSGCASDCTTSDDYYSDDGAIRCLLEGDGDVAFVRHNTVLEATKASSGMNRSDLRLLCKDGCFPLGQYKECNLAQAPGRAMIVSSVLGPGGLLEGVGLNIQAAVLNVSRDTDFLASTTGIVGQFAWSRTATSLEPTPKGYESYLTPEMKAAVAAFDTVMTSAKEEQLRTAENGNTEAQIQENGGETALGTAKTESRTAAFCARNPDEFEFCKKATDLLNKQQDELLFTCYAGENDNECLLAIGTGKADWGVVDAADIAFGYSNLGLQVVVAEEKGAGVGTNYFAVAVVKKEFCEAVESRNPYGASLADLRGVNSCHTGYRKNAGWRMPVGLMISQRIMPVMDNEPSVENDAESVAAYFNLSCAPRASNNGPQNTPDGNGRLWPPLCEICKGSCDNRDQYYDYAGALRCLIEDQGKVAFVKHSTVLGELPPFATSSDQDDFRLLCGDKSGCRNVTEYPTCHLARVPAHGVIVSTDSDLVKNSSLQNVLVAASRTDNFRALIFNRDRNPYSHIFSNDAVGLARFDGDTEEFLGEAGVIYRTLESIEVDPEQWVDSGSQTVNKLGERDGVDGYRPTWGVQHLTALLALFLIGFIW